MGVIDLLTSFLEGVGEPFESFIETVSRGGAGGLDVLKRSAVDQEK
jgi:hypothetical protein